MPVRLGSVARRLVSSLVMMGAVRLVPAAAARYPAPGCASAGVLFVPPWLGTGVLRHVPGSPSAPTSTQAIQRCMRMASYAATQPMRAFQRPIWPASAARKPAAGPPGPSRRMASAVPSASTLTHMQASAGMDDTGLWADDDATFAGLGLSEGLVDAIKQLGFARPTKIQAATLPAILEGKDVVMGAETGSGKTLAYMLPTLQRVLGEREGWDRRPEVLVLVPNQELARQVAAVIATVTSVSEALAVPTTMLAGSAGLSKDAACAILVATPSAILRNTEPAYLGDIHTCIIDEADMLLDGGFVTDVTRILDFLCPRISNTQARRLAKEGKTMEEGKAQLDRQPAQVIFAAATLPDWKGDKVKSVVRVLQKRFPDAQHISTTQLHKQSRAASHDWMDLGPLSTKEDAQTALLDLLRGPRRGQRTMVFCNTVKEAKETHEYVIQEGYDRALLLHKEVPPAERAAALAKLSTLPSLDNEAIENGEWILVCTDIAARGIDIPSVLHVIQLQFAANAVTHLHRVGRTARAGSSGGHVTNLIDDMSRPVALAIKGEAGDDAPIAPVFSRNRGFRRRFKRYGTGMAVLE